MLIVVVDDDELVRCVTAEILEEFGYSVIEATSGPDVLALMRDQTEPDLVISDVNMPEMDGRRLAEEIRAIRPSLPVILMSGRAGMDVGYPFLAKPFSRQGLLACIDRVTSAMTHAVIPQMAAP